MAGRIAGEESRALEETPTSERQEGQEERGFERVNTLMDRSGSQTRRHIIIAAGKSCSVNVSQRVFDQMENGRTGNSDLIAEERGKSKG